ncbi:MAG: oxidoreductase [Myxococcaceae bacterium]|nr:oxidoreductase [Myxococcaceae bacterium]
MNIAVLGTGVVGQTLGKKLVALGHTVFMGSRDASHPNAVAWAAAAGPSARHGTFAEAARGGEIIFNCTAGVASLEVLANAGHANLAEKVLVDVSNPLAFEKGKAPQVLVEAESVGERIQRAFPRTRVVKALNTMNCNVMVDPGRVASGEHDLFLAGDDATAKRAVEALLGTFGWRRFIDLGGIDAARAMEAYVELWIRLRLTLGTSDFQVAVVR